MYTIIKNREMPAIVNNSPNKYPFANMKVGECFDVSVNPANDYTYKRVANSLSQASYYFRTHKKPLTRWTTRTDRALQRVTVWRIK